MGLTDRRDYQDARVATARLENERLTRQLRAQRGHSQHRRMVTKTLLELLPKAKEQAQEGKIGLLRLITRYIR
jgi:hypothetical protein